ncbi:MAG: ECF transporter S component [Candidatus Thorarchaeota archaeon]|nr:ECF transporter S component [Candidatus Thorarchaeota archaeon]
MNASASAPLTTSELVTLALLSSLGGALSAFVGYLGNLVNLALGVPFGAGQFVAGLHVFWIVLIRLLIPRSGAASLGGLVKGVVELFAGSTHGVVIVLISFVQGIVVDIGVIGTSLNTLWSVSTRVKSWLVAGFSAASNVVIFQALYFSNVPLMYIVVISVLAFCSGVIFGGYFAWETLDFLTELHLPLRHATTSSALQSTTDHFISKKSLPALAFVIFLISGSLYYSVAVARTFTDPFSCDVVGLVDNPFIYRPSDFIGEETTIEATLIGSYTHLPTANYTGVPVHVILSRAGPQRDATCLRVQARDGYSALFALSSVMIDNRLILSSAGDGLWLIAGDYEGQYWVRQVVLIEVC